MLRGASLIAIVDFGAARTKLYSAHGCRLQRSGELLRLGLVPKNARSVCCSRRCWSRFPGASGAFLGTRTSLWRRRKLPGHSAMQTGVAGLEVRARSVGDDKDQSSARAETEFAVFRFTLGIPGFDDANLPRVIGIVVGILLLLNHFFSPGATTDAQWRSEAIGFLLAAVAIAVPELGRRMKEARGMREKVIPPEGPQVFALDENLGEESQQEIAWCSYVLLRNTPSTAVFLWRNGTILCARGSMAGFSSATTQPVEKMALLRECGEAMERSLNASEDLQRAVAGETGALYISSSASSSQQWDILPAGSVSALVQPLGGRPSDGPPPAATRWGGGALLLVSTQPRAFSKKDRLWAAALARKLEATLPERSLVQ